MLNLDKAFNNTQRARNNQFPRLRKMRVDIWICIKSTLFPYNKRKTFRKKNRLSLLSIKLIDCKISCAWNTTIVWILMSFLWVGVCMCCVHTWLTKYFVDDYKNARFSYRFSIKLFKDITTKSIYELFLTCQHYDSDVLFDKFNGNDLILNLGAGNLFPKWPAIMHWLLLQFHICIYISN